MRGHVEQLHEVVEHVGERVRLEVGEAVHGGEHVYVDAVLGVHVLAHERDARVGERAQLKHGGGVEDVDDVVAGDLDAAGVDEVEQALHGPRRDVLDVDLAEAALLQIAREHGLEVAAGGAQHHLVARKLDAVDVDADVAEERLVAERLQSAQPLELKGTQVDTTHAAATATASNGRIARLRVHVVERGRQRLLFGARRRVHFGSLVLANLLR